MKRLTWRRLSEFFESGDLVPFAVVTSVWHFIMAVQGYGEGWAIATATGIFVDMLHFRTVRMAVRSRSKTAVVIGIATTVMSYGFHVLFFYYQKDPAVFHWLMLFLASPLPIGIPILAWQQEVNREPIIVKMAKARVKALASYARKWQVAAKALESRAKILESVVKAGEATVKKLESYVKELESTVKVSEATVKALEAQVKPMEKELKTSKDRVNLLESRVEQLESEAKVDKGRVKELESQVTAIETGMKKLNPLAKDVYRLVVFGEGSGADIAKRNGVSEATVSKMKSSLNGGA